MEEVYQEDGKPGIIPEECGKREETGKGKRLPKLPPRTLIFTKGFCGPGAKQMEVFTVSSSYPQKNYHQLICDPDPQV
jgi:hypothetical protein